MQKFVERIVIFDFGSQYTQLIARRLREMNVYAEILSPETPWSALRTSLPKGIILSGGPASVADDSISFDKSLLESSIPILGICYGMQLLNFLYGGTVKSLPKKEYGKQLVTFQFASPMFSGLEKEETVWMSHGDSVELLAPVLECAAVSESGIPAVLCHKTRPQFGVQFHPEVTHTKNGSVFLKNFLDFCGCKRDWTMDHFLHVAEEEIRQKVGRERVVSLVSGGIDSTVSTFLCYRALGAEQIIPIHIDTGLMRAGESAEIVSLLRKEGMSKLILIDAQKRFLSALNNVVDPEEKRRIIGALFIQILEEEIARLEQTEGKKTFICQGTLYTDLIESGKGCGKHAVVIKTHHNVNPPIVEQKRKEGLIIEPNARIFKDEVRKAAAMMGIPSALIQRHPFPGPGLAIRILGAITQERLECLREADQIFLDEIRKANLYSAIWQAFVVLLPVSTVGVMGDQRTTGNAIALRAVSSIDGMTADFFPLPTELLGRIANRLINEVRGINRVVYDVTSKPPGTIEWE